MFTLKNALLVVVALASQAGLNGFVLGQQPQPPRVAIQKAAPGENSRVGAMLKGKENADPVIIKRFVNNEFSRMTNEADMANFAAIRSALLLAVRSGTGDVAKKAAADEIVSQAKAIVANPAFHNASRVNAMLALAELDLASNAPYMGTAPVLLTWAKEERLELHLRSIALYGLNRHARFSGLKDTAKEVIAKEMAVIVSTRPRFATEVKAHAWMVRRGFDVLSTLAAPHAVQPAIVRLLDDKELPSLRLAAADYLPRVDQSKMKLTDEQKVNYFVGLAQLLEQQLVVWYEREEDTLNMTSGAMGGGMMGGMGGMMGGMGDMGGGMEGGGGDGYGMGGMGAMGGEGGMMGGMGGMEGGYGGQGMGGMGGMGTAPKPKALETQPWEVRMTRRNVNQLLQTAHMALDGKQIKGGRPVSAVGKGLADLGLPAEISTPASDLLKAVESLQTRVNDSTKITTMNSLISQTKKLIERVMDQVREVPALTKQYPKYQEKKEDLNDVLDQPKTSPPAGDGTDPTAPAPGTAGDGAATPEAAAQGAPAPGAPAPGAPAPGTPVPGAPAPGVPAGPKNG